MTALAKRMGWQALWGGLMAPKGDSWRWHRALVCFLNGIQEPYAMDPQDAVLPENQNVFFLGEHDDSPRQSQRKRHSTSYDFLLHFCDSSHI